MPNEEDFYVEINDEAVEEIEKKKITKKKTKKEETK